MRAMRQSIRVQETQRNIGGLKGQADVNRRRGPLTESESRERAKGDRRRGQTYG